MHTFLIIVPDGGMLFESAGVADILMQANRLRAHADAFYHITIATTQPHRVIHGQSGLNLLADQRLLDLDPDEPRDTIMVTGRGVTEEENAGVADWLRLAAPHAGRVASVCSGALLLAQAGLLNGRRATTHWRLLESLQTRFSAVNFVNGPLYVQDGSFWTSGGVSTGFDLSLALVEDDLGFDLARSVAQEMVMYLRRPGGQAQFSRYLLNQAEEGPVAELQHWMAANLTAEMSVQSLAERLAMSPRNFTRVFTRETGISPAKYVEELRLSAARQRLEKTRDGIEQIACLCGFGNALNLRRVMERSLHVTPGEYRQRFAMRNMS